VLELIHDPLLNLITHPDLVLALHDSSFPLAHCMGFEAGGAFGFFARFDVANACFELEDILDDVHDLDKTPL